MPLDSHEMLYRKLADIADRVRFALKETDPDELALLAEEHETIVKELQQAGISPDERLLGMLQALGRQVSEVITEIQQCQHEISIRIKEVADGRKMIHAYVA